MRKEIGGIRPRELTPRERLWVDNFRAGETPGSLELAVKFINSLHSGDQVLEVGCGYGRMSISLRKKRNVSVTGVDINTHEISSAQKNSAYSEVGFEAMDGTQLEYLGDQFDSVVMVGVLGGVEREIREKLLSQAFRVVKPGGSLAVAEFKMNTSDPEKVEKYKADAKITGEWGSKIIRRRIKGIDKILFVARHFTREELISMFEDAGFSSIQSREHNTIKAAGIGDGIEEVRRQYTVWGVKPIIGY